MQNLINLFSLPFVQRAFIGGLLVSILTSFMGTLVVLRRSSFFGDAIAHSSLMGVALGLLLGIDPIVVAALYAIFVAFLLPVLTRYSNLPTDSLLGFILPFSMGVGVIILAFVPGYQPELISFLFGSILSISWVDVLTVSVLALATLIFLASMRKKLILTSFDSVYAKISGIKVDTVDILYHILLAVTVVAGIRLVGIVLVNALLVIPASTARLYVRSLKSMLIVTPILAVLVTLLGIVLSFATNLPSGPTIAVVSGGVFLGSLVLSKFKKG